MHNSDIHKNFDRSDVRDFLAQELERSRMKSGGADVEWLMAEIRGYQDLLAAARQREATIELMGVCGWEDWGISEEVPYDKEAYFPFVGTEEEYANLLGQIERERDQKE